ncbi:hypothetical protein, partial [Rhizobium sp. UBA1881]|uniref:hypothetical protein n=1 Tax=Rhizobium sp. UBA1881 TaxID=1947375 RepID=UPI0025E3699B
MKQFLKSTHCRLCAASILLFILAAAAVSSPFQIPDFVSAVLIALGVVLLIYNFGRFDARPRAHGTHLTSCR